MGRSFTGTLLTATRTTGAARPRNDAPVPLTRTRSGFAAGILQGAAGAGTQLDAMSQSGRLYAIVTRLATATAGLTWHLYEKSTTGDPADRREITRHPALTVWQQWNQFTSCAEGVEVFQQHLDLAGRGCLLVGRDPRAAVPLELWPVRPDRLIPVKHPTKFLTGWIYRSPDGEEVPLRLDEVLETKTPNPADPYGALSPVQTIMTDVQSLQYAREWNRNFFLNSAEPGGIIEVDRRLSDDEFDELVLRWREQHQGVARAHRVALLEQGKWVDRRMTQKDMEFTSLHGLSTEAIRDAYGFPKPSLGAVDDVNRANADAADVLLARHCTTPRGNRIRGMLNNRFLPLFGPASEGLEFDFDSPVPEDHEAENAERDSKVGAWVALTGAGVKPSSASEYLGLPEFEVEEPEPVPAALQQPPAAPPVPGQDPADPGDQVPDEGQPDALARLRRTTAGHPPATAAAAGCRCTHHHPTAAAAAPEDEPSASQAALDVAIAAVLAAWAAGPLTLVKNAIADAIRALVETGARTGLPGIAVDSVPLADVLSTAMVNHAATAAGQVVAEAAAQGVSVSAGVADAGVLDEMAQAAAGIYVRDLETSAAREALRVWGPAATPDAVRDAVATHLGDLTDAGPRAAVEPALVMAEGHGRLATLNGTSGTVGSIYAREQRDKNTCGPCAAIDGRFLGTTDDIAQVFITHPNGSQYIGCLGRGRCRGEIEGIWRR